MTRWLPVLLLLSSLTWAQRSLAPGEPVRALPSSEKRFALVIGVDEYDDASISRLQGAGNDARATRDTLVKYAGFREQNIVVLATGEPVARRPTRANIIQRLSNMLAVVPSDGLFVFVFSGHGIERGNRAFLLPADTAWTDDPSVLEDLSIGVKLVRDRIAARGIQQVLVLLDACRNDPGGRSDAPNPMSTAFRTDFRFEERNREVQAFATVYATAVGDRAFEYQEKKRGYFSWALEEALSGKAANERGEVTLGRAIEYLQDRVPRQVSLDLGSTRHQRPFADVSGFLASELVLSVAPVVVAPPPVNEEEVYWRQCETNKGAFCSAYLVRFPQGRYAPLARLIVAPPPVSVPSTAVMDAAQMEREFADAKARFNRKDYSGAFPIYLRLANAGHVPAMVDVGYMYDIGLSVQASTIEAVGWYRRAAEAGDAMAMRNLGVSYQNGDGVQKSDTEAIAWYVKAAAAGLPEGMSSLAWMHEKGRGVPKSDTEAAAWYRKAADGGDRFAMRSLANMIEEGRGVPKNPAEAKLWRERADKAEGK